VLALVAGIGAALTFGYLGGLHPAFDSFSHLRLHLAGLLLLLVPFLAALGFRPEAMFALLLGLAAPIQTVALLAATGGIEAQDKAGPATYRLLHLNLRYDNPTPEAVLSMIGQSRPDVVTLTEVSDLWIGKLALIEAAYPHQLICPKPTFIGGVAILSRRPFADRTQPHCGNRGAFAHAGVDFGGETVEIAALHMGWPWPFEQPWQIPRLEPLLHEIGRTAIIAGDLNAVPWSHAARRLAAAADARLLHGIGPSWLHRVMPQALLRWVGLPIDNVMVKGRVMPGTLDTLGDVGSDHRPVMMEFSLPPRERPIETLRAGVAGQEESAPAARL
jgi:endonuclease/exonuclease/phosphatase (EEP) superfamily protein YafD